MNDMLPKRKLIYYLRFPILVLLGSLATGKYWHKVLRAEIDMKRSVFHEWQGFLKIKTYQGIFNLKNSTADLVVVSPAFEYFDMARLIEKIEFDLMTSKKLIFIDAGANFGKFTVVLGNRFKAYSKKFKIYAFEPEKTSYKLLRQNIKDNKLKNVRAFNLALTGKKGLVKLFIEPDYDYFVSYPTTGKAVIMKTNKLDNLIKVDKNTIIYMKMDIEGYEVPALEGAKKIIKKSHNMVMLIEDVAYRTKRTLLKYLKANFSFLERHGIQNSFWEKL